MSHCYQILIPIGSHCALPMNFPNYQANDFAGKEKKMKIPCSSFSKGLKLHQNFLLKFIPFLNHLFSSKIPRVQTWYLELGNYFSLLGHTDLSQDQCSSDK